MTEISMAGVITTPDAAIEVPAVRLNRGGRVLYQMALKSVVFGSVVPTVPMHVVQTTQRGYHEAHARRIARFIANNPNGWAFGPISLAIAPKHVGFRPFAGIGDTSVQYGTLTFKPGSSEAMVILDGQHRRAALHMLHSREAGRISTADYEAAVRSIDASDISVDLYEIAEVSDTRRVFGWMNTTQSVSTSERILLDNSNPFNSAVQRLIGTIDNRYKADKLGWLADLVIPLTTQEFRRVGQSIQPGTKYWLSALNVKAMLLARIAGSQRTTQAVSNTVKVPEILDVARVLFIEELPLLRSEWGELRDGSVEALDMPVCRRRTLAYDASVALVAAWSLGPLKGDMDTASLAAKWQTLSLDTVDPSMLFGFARVDGRRPHLMNSYTNKSAADIIGAIQLDNAVQAADAPTATVDS